MSLKKIKSKIVHMFLITILQFLTALHKTWHTNILRLLPSKKTQTKQLTILQTFETTPYPLFQPPANVSLHKYFFIYNCNFSFLLLQLEKKKICVKMYEHYSNTLLFGFIYLIPTLNYSKHI